MPSEHDFRLKLFIIVFTMFYSGLSQAEELFFPLYPRLNVTGGMGNNNFGAADVMTPLFGSTDAIVYTDMGGQTGKGKSNFLSLGFGARDAVNDDVMWGGYIFVDRSKANDENGSHHWTVLNPGIELMTNHWDGRVNGYIPTGNKENMRGPFYGDQVNMPNAVSFNQHDKFSYLFNKVDEIGAGLDVDAGYTFTHLKRFRVHSGGYYFNLQDTGNISGGEAGAEMPINNYATLQFDDSYDNVQKNTAVVSVRFTLGGIDKSANVPTVQDRILDPIYRHLGALATNTGIPSNHSLLQISGPPVLEQSNIWFFNANSGVAFDPAAGNNNCTYLHPCIGTSFDQSNINIINGIDSNANFYFTPGTYTFAAPNNLNLNLGQSMYGRNSTYTLPASPNSGFPTFVGEIDPLGNNTLDSFALVNNNGAQSIGIHVQNADNVMMNNLQIGDINNAGKSFTNSIVLEFANNTTVQNSNIQSLTNALDASIFTVMSINKAVKTTFDHNTSAMNTTNPNGTAIGIINEGNVTTNLSDNNFSIIGSSAIGMRNALFNGSLTATNNLFTITATGVSPLIPNAVGIVTLPGDTGAVTLTGNTFHISSLNGTAEGIFNFGTHNTYTLNNNLFFLTSNVSNIGIDNTAGNVGAITGSNNSFTLTGSGTNTDGINIGAFFTNPGNNNTCTINGNPC